MNKKNKSAICILLAVTMFLAVTVVSAQGYSEIYTIGLNYKKQPESISLVEIKKNFGTLPNYDTGDSTAYRLDIIATDKSVLKSMKFSAPSKGTLFKGLTNENQDNTDFVISVPYYPNAKFINIYDKNNNKVLEIPLPQEQSLAQPKSPTLNWPYIALPLVLVFGFLTYLEVKRKNDHKMLMQQVQQQSILTLKNYVTTNLRKGYGKEQIRNALAKNNYSNQEIEEAFKGLR